MFCAQLEFNRLPEETSAPIRELLTRCLDRDPKSRLRDLSQASVVLRECLAELPSVSATGRPVRSLLPAAAQPIRRRIWLPAGALAMLGLAAASAALYPGRSKPLPAPEQWRQITDFPDAATDPVLSTDGHMLAFMRGEGSWFLERKKQLYVKLLPDGPPVQLTHDELGKMSPAFSPDGSRLAYTVSGFDTWMVPVLGPAGPQLMFRKAEGLTWIDSQRILFSENTPSGMGVETSMESGLSQREIYMPANGMAHFSSLSPNGKQVLVIERVGSGPFIPCRLLPFHGSSRGRQVGPAPARCTAAAWTPDGKEMYFTADAGKGSHIWRQRLSGGKPEQLTFGITEEYGLAIAPDGGSLFTSVGTTHGGIWVHNAKGDLQISVEGDGSPFPLFAVDGSRVYYQVRGEVRAVLLATGREERPLPGVTATGFILSQDGASILYTMADKTLDRGSRPPFLRARSPFKVNGPKIPGNRDSRQPCSWEGLEESISAKWRATPVISLACSLTVTTAGKYFPNLS